MGVECGMHGPDDKLYKIAQLIKHYAMYGEWRYSATILDLGTGWR
jgi:hypothetical protein